MNKFNSIDIFSKAVKDVLVTMTGMDVLEKESEHKNGLIMLSEITGKMILFGLKTAVILLTMEKETAKTIISYMTGVDTDDINEDDLCDGTAELVNMIAGNSKAMLKGTDYHFALTQPCTLNGENCYYAYKDKSYNEKKYFIDNKEIKLFIKYI